MAVIEKSAFATQLKAISFNATSIRGKLSDFNSHFDIFSATNDYDIIALTETWLNDSVFDEEILYNSDYAIFRRDRDKLLSNKKDGGGVMIAVSSKFPAKRREDLESNLEIIWVELKLDNSRKAFFGTVYLPPYSKLAACPALEESLDRVRSCAAPGEPIVILGDFNMSDAVWTMADGMKHAVCQNHSNVNRMTSQLLEVFYSNEFSQHNILPTCNDRPLDLVFSNNLSICVDYAMNPTSSTHRALELHIDVPSKSKATFVDRMTFNFKKADFDAIHRLLACICWSALLPNNCANDALSYLYDVIFAVINDCVPVVKLRKSKFPPWYNADLISLIKEKEHVRKLFVKSGRDRNSDAYLKFCSLRANVKSMQKDCHTAYVNQVSQQIGVNPKRFWSYVKSQRISDSLPKLMSYNSIEYTSLSDIVRAFCMYFESVFTVHDGNAYPYCPQFEAPSFCLPRVTSDEMKNAILSLDRFTCTGYDNVPAIFLIECASELCHPLSMIFNLSVDLGEYPTLLKFNNVVPIYKNKGDKSSVTSYRPISIQPVVSKLFEKIVNEALRKHLKLLICDEQHGFVPMRSTATNLVSYSDFITKAFDEGVQVHTIYTDFHKAFDCVSHKLLLYKMSNLFGIQGADLLWFNSYLSDRQQRVVMGGIESDWVSVPSGVPQGSILGPSLFIMYINDLPSQLRFSDCMLYADDVKIYKRISCLGDCLELQRDIISLSEWCSQWRMNLNLAKCCFMNFSLKRDLNILFDYTLNGYILQRVLEIKDLGVTFSMNMSFNAHITNVVSKALRMLGFVHRTMKHVNDVSVFKTLYFSYIRSGLEYCSPVWCPTTKQCINKIERVQRRFVKLLCFRAKVSYSGDSYAELCNFFQLTSLENRRKVADLLFFHKILHSKVNAPSLLSNLCLHAPSRRTRHSNVFATISRCRLLVRGNSFFHRSVTLANGAQKEDNIDFFNINFCRFKRSLCMCSNFK